MMWVLKRVEMVMNVCMMVNFSTQMLFDVIDRNDIDGNAFDQSDPTCLIAKF